MQTTARQKNGLDLKAVAVLIVLCASWGLQQVSIKYANQAVPPVLQGGLRSIGALILLWIWMLARREKLVEKDGSLWWGLGAGLLFSLEFTFIYLGLKFTSASRAVVFLYTMPFAVALGAQIFIPVERLSLVHLAGLVCAFGGIVAAFSESLGVSTPDMLIGDSLMLAAAVLISETVVLGMLPPLTFAIVLSLIVPALSEMGSFALNDYLDIETDRLNKKANRPLVRGSISPGFALNLSIVTLALSPALALLINMPAFIIALSFNALAVIYNWKLKDLPLVGNIYIALTMAIPFIFGNFVVSDSLSQVALSLAALGFVAGLAREIIKSVQDMDGDMLARGSKTIPVVIGRGPSLLLAVALYLAFIPLSAAPFALGLEQRLPAIGLVLAGDVMILAVCYKALAHNDFRYARDGSLRAFIFGMLGIMAAAL